jgi:hypothetical protein
MALTLYLVTQWGNAKSPDANGDDTYLLVRATSVEQAGEIADCELAMMPTAERLCNRIVELGISAEPGGDATVIIRPFISGLGLFNIAGCRVWLREEGLSDDWQDQNEIFRD